MDLQRSTLAHVEEMYKKEEMGKEWITLEDKEGQEMDQEGTYGELTQGIMFIIFL